MKFCFDQGWNDIGVVTATKQERFLTELSLTCLEIIGSFRSTTGRICDAAGSNFSQKRLPAHDRPFRKSSTFSASIYTKLCLQNKAWHGVTWQFLSPLYTVPAWDYDSQFDVALISILHTDISLFLHEIAKSLKISAWWNVHLSLSLFNIQGIQVQYSGSKNRIRRVVSEVHHHTTTPLRHWYEAI